MSKRAKTAGSQDGFRAGIISPPMEQDAAFSVERCTQPAGGVVKESNMGIILWLVVGGIIGWLASMVMRTDAQQGILLNIVVGIVGAFIGGLIFSGGSINEGLTLYSFLVSLVGAIILLAIVNLVRRGSVR
ncbi:putative membrane protein YeaQ/YmgE (transglycosylase-associated protein family) [Sphingobium olei]